MLWTVSFILFLLWALGIVSATTLGGFIHVLLAMAVAVVLLRAIQGSRPSE
ncbi:MAG TPA: lmo0937 family membrane protein [Gemmatimonadales bacterium]